jgi:hypothetical protein
MGEIICENLALTCGSGYGRVQWSPSTFGLVVTQLVAQV